MPTFRRTRVAVPPPAAAIRGSLARAAVEAIEPRVLFATFAVTSVADAGPGTLRQAILDANASAGADAIEFAIPGTGPFTIRPATSLPAATGPTSVDGRTQPGYAGAPLVELAGDAIPKTGGLTYGLTLTGDGSAVTGLAINRFQHGAVDLRASDSAVRGNYIGLTPAGTRTWTAQDGGVVVTGDRNVVGGTAAGDRNVIAGAHTAVSLRGDANVVRGNLIGTAPDGVTAVPGGTFGVYVSSGAGNQIGGPLAAARNVIAAVGTGVTFESGTAAGTVVRGNYIGTDATGSRALPNGVGIDATSPGTVIGGTQPGEGNVIAGNAGDGVRVRADFAPGDGSAVIEGNRIGVAADGSPLGNGGAGVSIENTSGNRVGGPFIPSANVIAFNAGPGVRITGGASAAGNAVPGNSIHENGGLGIDLGDDGYTGRDPLDADAGPNGLQNAPVVVALTPSAGGIGYVARVRLSSAPSTTYRVELFETAAESDPSGSGEGTFFLNGYVVTTDAAGEAVLEVPVFALRAGGNRVSATATAPDGSTSEFSNALGADGFAPAGGLAAPSRPMLAAASDTGASDADGITADATPTYVGTAAPGTTVHLMVDGYRCGAAVVGDDGTYAVTPDAALADRANRVVTAFVSAPGFAYSPVSDASFVTIDTAGPRVTFRPPGGLIAPTPVNAVPFDFDEPVTGIGAGDVAVALDGAPLALPAGYAPAATGPRSGVASLLFTYPQSPGAYTISLAAGAVTDVAGNPSAAGSATFYAVTGGGNVAAVATTRTTVEGSPTPARFTLVRAAAAGQGLAAPLTVNLTVVSQGYVLLATPGADYAALPASVTFPAGASTVTVDVLAADDAVYDPNEGVGLLVQPGPGVVTSGTPAFVRITDPTPPVVATIDPLPVLTTVLPTVTIRLSRAVTSLSGAVRVGGKVVADAQLSTPDGGSTWVVTGLSAQTEFPGNYKVQVSTVVVAAADGKQALMNGATAEYNLLYPTSVQLMPGPRSPLGVIDAAYAQVNNPPLGLALSDFVLTRGADPTNLLAGAPPEVALSTDPLLTITGLSAVATEPGDYRLTLRPWAAIPDGLGGFVHEVVDATWTVPPPPPPVLALRAPADAQVRDGTYAGTNYGAAATVEVRRSSTAGSTREGYVRFDLTGVAAADLITSVKVRLYGKLSAAGSVPVGLFPVADAAWAESGLKWSNKPAAGATPLATRTVGSTAGAWFEFDVTAYVREQKRAGAGGVSFALKATAAAGVQVLFNTDESSANRPELKVTQGPPPVGIAVSSSAVTVGEGKAAGLTVKLAAKPAASVVVTVARTSGDGDLSASPTKLTFTPANWDVAQTVTLAAAQDADTSNGTATFTLSGVGLTARTFAATEADDDRVLRAAADSYVRDGSTAGTNYGGGGSLFVRASATAGSTRWTVLKFDLTKAATVSSATLRLFGKVESTAAASVKVQAFAASSSSWTEGGVTWNNKPAPTGSSLGEATVSGTAAKWYAIDLTSWLQSLKAAGKTTAALVLTSPAATTAAAVFNSDEAAGSRPELLVRA